MLIGGSMKKQIFKLIPEFRERIWGGEKIKTEFNGQTDIDPVGEMWVVAPFKNKGDNQIEGLDITLSQLYDTQPDWFKCDTPIVPIRCTIIDPLSDLSVQVHPDEEYALRVDQSLGKPEAWYVIDCKSDSRILYGHNAKDKDELKEMTDQKKWNELLRYINAEKEGFLMVKEGDVHALGKDVLCFEISRAADLTYRVYDYDRVDKKTGKLRDLHIQKSLDVINVPHQGEGLVKGEKQEKETYTLTTFVDSPGQFTLYKIDTSDNCHFELERFYFLTVIDGEGKIGSHASKKGDTFFVPDLFGPISIDANLEILISSYKNARETT